MINKRKDIKALERNSLIFKDIIKSYCTKELIFLDKIKQDFVQKIKNINRVKLFSLIIPSVVYKS